MCHGGLDVGGENANCFEQSYEGMVARGLWMTWESPIKTGRNRLVGVLWAEHISSGYIHACGGQKGRTKLHTNSGAIPVASTFSEANPVAANQWTMDLYSSGREPRLCMSA